MSRVVWVLLGEEGQLGKILDWETAVSLPEELQANILTIEDIPDSVSDTQLLMLIRWRNRQLESTRTVSYSQLVAIHSS